MRHKLELIKTSDVSYSTVINGHTIAMTYIGVKYLKDFMRQDKQKWLLALSKIPKRAKLVLSKDDKRQCTGMLMGGWLCDSRRTVYGIFDGKGFLGLTPCIVWIPTKAELDKLLYSANKGDGE